MRSNKHNDTNMKPLCHYMKISSWKGP